MAGRQKNRDPRGGHVRIYWDLIDSLAWKALSATDVMLYVAMRRTLKGSNNGDISATLATLRHSGFKSSATLAKSLRTLKAVGLIANTRAVGGLTYGGTVCNLYRFTDEDVYAMPNKGVSRTAATKDFRLWQTLAQAQSAIAEAHASAKRPNHANAAKERAKRKKVQRLNVVGSVSEAPRFNIQTTSNCGSSETEPTHEAATKSPSALKSEHLCMLPASGRTTRVATAR